MDKETLKKLKEDFDNMCEQYDYCWDCPYDSHYCEIIFGYEKGYTQAKRDMDTRTDIQRFRVSGHP